MASESTDDDSTTVSVPGDIEDWLAERAERLDTDEATVLVRIVTAYRHAAELADGTGDEAVEALLSEALEDTVDSMVAQAMAGEDLAARVDALEEDVDEKIEDVRERVLQVKRETDEKAPAEHTHEALDRVEDLAEAVDGLEADLDGLADRVGEIEDEVAAVADEREAAAADLEATVDDVQERLQTVAWVVSDLREAYEASGVDAVDRIKRAAAQADVSRARCENCSAGVEIGLLTEPNCPHCGATVTNVKAASGFFGKPELLVASQLESGEDR